MPDPSGRLACSPRSPASASCAVRPGPRRAPGPKRCQDGKRQLHTASTSRSRSLRWSLAPALRSRSWLWKSARAAPSPVWPNTIANAALVPLPRPSAGSAVHPRPPPDSYLGIASQLAVAVAGSAVAPGLTTTQLSSKKSNVRDALRVAEISIPACHGMTRETHLQVGRRPTCGARRVRRPFAMC